MATKTKTAKAPTAKAPKEKAYVRPSRAARTARQKRNREIDKAAGYRSTRRGRPTRLGKKNSPEHRRLQSVALKKYWRSPEGKKRKDNRWGIFNTTRVPVSYTRRFQQAQERLKRRAERKAMVAQRQAQRKDLRTSIRKMTREAAKLTGAAKRKLTTQINKATKALSAITTKRGPGKKAPLDAGVRATTSRSGTAKRGKGKKAA